MSEATLPPTGRYRHYKGGAYVVIGYALHTETDELLALYHPEALPGLVFARPLSSWVAPAGGRPRFVAEDLICDLCRRPVASSGRCNSCLEDA